MSWLLLMWVSLTVLLMSEGTFYETIQQHLAPPGTNIQILGESFVSFTPRKGKKRAATNSRPCFKGCFRVLIKSDKMINSEILLRIEY